MGTVRGVLSHCPANWVEKRVPPLYRHASGGEGNPCNLSKSYSAYSISELIFAVFCNIAEKEQPFSFSFDKLTESAAALSRPSVPAVDLTNSGATVGGASTALPQSALRLW
jgi:hypothetical protein